MLRAHVILTGSLALSVSAMGCASSGAVPKPFPMPSAAPAARPGASGIVGTALQLRGLPYKNGGADRSGFDCSGFTQYVFAQYGVDLPRAVHEQFKMGNPVMTDQVVAGDLLFFTTTAPGASHVAIAIDDDAFVHAPSSSGVVRVEHRTTRYWSDRFIGARRLALTRP